MVYKIKSNDCTRKHDGEVDCKLKERIKKLSSDSEKPKKKENITWLFQHMNEAGHKTAWKDIKITHYEIKWKERLK